MPPSPPRSQRYGGLDSDPDCQGRVQVVRGHCAHPRAKEDTAHAPQAPRRRRVARARWRIPPALGGVLPAPSGRGVLLRLGLLRVHAQGHAQDAPWQQQDYQKSGLRKREDVRCESRPVRKDLIEPKSTLRSQRSPRGRVRCARSHIAQQRHERKSGTHVFRTFEQRPARVGE